MDRRSICFHSFILLYSRLCNFDVVFRGEKGVKHVLMLAQTLKYALTFLLLPSKKILKTIDELMIYYVTLVIIKFILIVLFIMS